MKKLYTLMLLVLFANVTKAQLILTKSSNEPIIGDAERRKSFDTTSYTSGLPQNTGTNQVWNFTSLATNTTNMSNTTYTTPSSVTGSGSYTAATIASTDGGSNNSFFKSSATQYELLGVNASSLSLTFTNSAIMAVWPMTYGYTNTDPIAGSVSVSSLSGTFSGTVITNATGTGTVQLPYGVSLGNCLQVKSRQVINGSFLFGFVTATVNLTTIQYYHASQKFPVLEQNVTAITTATASYNSTVTAVTLNNDVFAGINELSLDNSYAVYPNPASNFINIRLSNETAEPVKVEISNQLGQPVRSVDIGSIKNIESAIDISGLAKGIYFVKTSAGERRSVKKLIVD